MNSWMNVGFTVTEDNLLASSIGEHHTSQLSRMKTAINAQLAEFVSDSWPLELDRLVARQSFETWYLQAASKLDLIEGASLLNDHAISPKRKLFESQNAQASAYHQSRAHPVLSSQYIPNAFRTALGNSQVPIKDANSAKPLTLGTSQSAVVAAPDEPNCDSKLSVVLSEYLSQMRLAGKSKDSLSADKLIVEFFVAEFDDPIVGKIATTELKKLELMMVDIPDRINIPKEHLGSLSSRYRYASVNGWDGLKRLTGARIQKGYHSSLSKFFGWLIEKGYYLNNKPIFRYVSPYNLVSLPRDSFSDEEVLEIISMPLFSGCDGSKRIWKPGKFFLQTHLYWAYLLLLLTGLRPGELGQLQIDDFTEKDGIWYLNLRGFDPTKGRVAFKDVTRFKTKNSERVVPLHPLITDLGFLDRVDDLRSAGCPVVFPEWEPYPKPDGEMRWGQPITKSWQYLKTRTSITRKDVTVYSTRHWFADLVDNSDISDRARKRLMGHADKSDIASGYGSKTRLTVRDLSELVNAKSPVIDAMTAKLLAAKSRADAGDLQTFKPWLSRASWSEFYRNKLADADEL